MKPGGYLSFVVPIQLLTKFTDVKDSWYKHFVIGSHSNLVSFNFLQTLTTKCPNHELGKNLAPFYVW